MGEADLARRRVTGFRSAIEKSSSAMPCVGGDGLNERLGEFSGDELAAERPPDDSESTSSSSLTAWPSALSSP